MSMRVYHDSRNELYRLPGGAAPAGGRVRMRLWVSQPVKQVWLRVWVDAEERLPMRALGAHAGGIMYEAELPLPGTPGLCWYCFLLREGGRDYWYGNAADHLGGEGMLCDHQPPSYQITVYDPAYMPPEWMRAGAMYQIFPDRFFRTDIGPNGRLGAQKVWRDARSSRAAQGEGAAPAQAAPEGAASAECEPLPFERVRPLMHSNWYEKPILDISANGDNSARDFFGGTLRGITAKLDYLRHLGVTVLYLNPIFLSPSNHRYNCSDYLRVDPRLGDEADLRMLCKEAKRRGMHILLDGVFSHTGDDSVYFNRYGTFAGKGACQGEGSPYHSWYTFEHFPDKYQCWWGFDTLPEVNEASPSFRRFICGPEDGEAAGGAQDELPTAQSRRCPEGIVRHYLRLGASGWRLDVADELPMDFIARIRRAALAEKPDAAILGEVWEDASNKEAYGQVRCYFKGDTLDSVMNYPLRDMAIDFMLCRITGGDFARRYMAQVENYPRPALHALMNLLGSHDRPRIMNLMAGMDANMSRQQQMHAAVPAYACGLAARRVNAIWRMVCALPGMPCIYYGDEAGARGMGDPFNRGTYPWGYEDEQLIEDFRTALEVRQESDALLRGDVRVFAPCDDVVAIVRALPDGLDYAGMPCRASHFMALVNRSLSAVSVCLEARGMPRYEGLRRQGDMYVVELPALTTGYFAGIAE